LKLLTHFDAEDEVVELMAIRLDKKTHDTVLEEMVELMGTSKLRILRIDADSIIAEIEGATFQDVTTLLKAGWSWHA